MKKVDLLLVNTVRSAIDAALTQALSNPKLNEPTLVAKLVQQIPLQINNALPLPPGLSIRSGGVFVHQTPKVKWTTPAMQKHRSVEIGDLLLLRKEIVKGKPEQTRALLLQAKKIDSNWAGQPDNPDQHTLYHEWPPFEYVRSTPALNGEKRHVISKDIYMGAKYLLLSNSPYPKGCCCHTQYIGQSGCICKTAMPTSPELSFYHCFADELTQFILGLAGLKYIKAGKRIGWDKVIEDLTTITAEILTVYTKTNKAKGLRGQGDYKLCFLSGDTGALSFLDSNIVSRIPTLDENDGDSINNFERGNEGEDGGISIIEFTVSYD
ncbi:MAG: hypothetical protein LBT35_01455 [Tannerella sp.]|jgi:hypothetical protein|nr:hypothetical protein [Tannerella sp.]